ncbi:MAG: ABC transporter permease [Clostridiales bacterium]|nr:ABC transporter permease [Clostridiales bacterium]
MNIFKKIYNYRELLKTNVKKEIRGKYKNSILGIMWSFLNPLLQLVVYSVIFGALLAGGDNTYPIYVCVALIPWTYFTSAITQSSFTIIGNGNIIKKVYFPREILPISVVTSGAINFIISTIIILAFLVISGLGITKYIIFYPVILLVQYLLILGISFILSSVTVYFRDLEHIIGITLLAAFYATPIVYKLEQLPSNLQIWMKLNPMTHIINSYRDIFYYQRIPDMQSLGILCLASVGLTIGGYFIFKKLQRGFAEEL